MNNVPSSIRQGVRPITLRTAVEVCSFVDELDEDDTGELMIGDANLGAKGAVFVERKRVCWVAARGLAPRLSQLLCERAKLERTALEPLYLACKEQKRPLGEYLVERGIVAADELRTVLLEHTSESLHNLCGAPVTGAWLPRTSGGYSPRFTFTTAEVLASTLAHDAHGTFAPAVAEVDECFSHAGWGAVFVRGSSATPSPVAVRGTPPAASRILLQVGKWAASALDIASTFQDDDAVLWVRSGPSALVAFRYGDLIVAGETNESGPARIMNRRARRRREEGARHGRI